MRAVMIEDKKKLVVGEVAAPKPDGNNVILRITKCGICGSDLHMWENGDRKGLIMGHEFAGIVEDPGALKDTLKAGDRVTALPLNPCGKCEACQAHIYNHCAHGLDASPGITAAGAYAQYYAARPDMVRKLPDHVSDDEAAMLEPTAVALRAVHLANIKVGDKVLIAGGGIIGLLVAAWAKISGASYIAMTEANTLRADNAKAMGDVDEVFNALDEQLVPKLMQASGGGFTHFIDCAAVAPAINTGIMALKHSGRMVLAGVNYSPVPISTLLLVIKEIAVQPTFGYVYEFDQALDLIAKNKINLKRFISGIVGLDGVQEAFERLTAGTYPDVKILIQP